MSNIIDSIQLSGTVYTIQGSGGGGSPTVELTQAEYDALVTAGTVSQNTYYIITDATAGDLTQYWTSAQTQSAITSAVSTKQDTLVSGTNIKTINNESLLGSGNIDIQGGGGKAIEAGRGISVTTGATADTVAFNLPIYDRGNTSVSECHEENGNVPVCLSVYCHLEQPSGIIGSQSNSSHKEGAGSKIGDYSPNSHVEGYKCEVGNLSPYSHAEGQYTKTSNQSEHASGQYNASSRASSTFGNSGNTLFSVGNGTADNARHNAFEIRQNGDIYLSSGGTDIKLQDHLGGGGGGYVTTDTEQIISGRKIFTYSSSSGKAIEFKQTSNSAKVGFSVKNSASTNNEVASFEFRPNTFTIDNVQHPLMYFGHYRNTNTANAGVPQTVIGFRQYDQLNAAAYHYLMPLPEKAKTPFNLTTSFKDYYAPMGFKNGSTMITADNTGVVDLSSELGGLKLVKLTQAEYDALAAKDSNTLYVIVN